MDKNAKEKLPNVLALLMGMLGMTAMTVMCYATDTGSFSPREIAIKATTAWGVMLVLGYIVGVYARQFVPEPPGRGGAVSIGGEGGAAIPAVTAKAGEAQTMDETINFLLNESPELPTPAPAGFAPHGGAATIPVQPPVGGAR